MEGLSVVELQEKLVEHEGTLVEVAKALEAAPDDPEIISLQTNLLEVVELTKSIITDKIRSEGGFLGREPTDNDATEEAIQEQFSSPVRHEVPVAVGTAAIGRTCRVVIQGEVRFGEVKFVTRDPQTNESRASVELIGSHELVALAAVKVHLLHPVPPALLIPGTKAQAIWSEDGIWYDCEIEEQTTNGYAVVYTHYGNREEVPFDRVRLPSKDGKRKRKIKEIITKGGYKIPENLQIQSTDSEHQKQLKKKRANMLKKEQRKELVEGEARQKQGSWLGHAHAASSRAKTGYGKGKSKDSIFRTTDLPEAKVGVTRSGMGMTSYGSRQKHDFQEDDAE